MMQRGIYGVGPLMTGVPSSAMNVPSVTAGDSLLHQEFKIAINPNMIGAHNILDLFCDPENPFYNRECLNQQLRMQRIDPSQIINCEGIEYVLLHAAPPLYVIRKQYRNGPKVTPQAAYYCIADRVLQAPDVASTISARLGSSCCHLLKAFELSIKELKHSVSAGYYWQFAAEKAKQEDQETEQQKRPESIRASWFQRTRVDSLLNDLSQQFPLSNVAAGASVASKDAASGAGREIPALGNIKSENELNDQMKL